MAYYALENLVLNGEEFAIGDELPEDHPDLSELTARNLVTDRPPHRKNSFRRYKTEK